MTVDEDFGPVAEAIKGAVLVGRNGWDEIVLAMDSAEADKFREMNYETFVSTPNLMLARVRGWYLNSTCIGAVWMHSRNPDGRSWATLLISKENKEVK